MHDLKPKTAYLAAKVLSSTLAGYSVDRMPKMGNDEDFALILQKGRNTAIASWTMGEEHQITLPVPAGNGMLIDMLGDKKPLSWPENALKLTISQAPQYILIQRD